MNSLSASKFSLKSSFFWIVTFFFYFHVDRFSHRKPASISSILPFEPHNYLDLAFHGRTHEAPSEQWFDKFHQLELSYPHCSIHLRFQVFGFLWAEWYVLLYNFAMHLPTNLPHSIFEFPGKRTARQKIKGAEINSPKNMRTIIARNSSWQGAKRATAFRISRRCLNMSRHSKYLQKRHSHLFPNCTCYTCLINGMHFQPLTLIRKLLFSLSHIICSQFFGILSLFYFLVLWTPPMGIDVYFV